MDAERIGDKERNATRADGGIRNGVLAAVTIGLLLVLASSLAAALPRALRDAAYVAGTSAVIRAPSADGQHPYPREIEEEQPEARV